MLYPILWKPLKGVAFLQWGNVLLPGTSERRKHYLPLLADKSFKGLCSIAVVWKVTALCARSNPLETLEGCLISPQSNYRAKYHLGRYDSPP